MKCVKDGQEIERPVSTYDTRQVDPLDRTTWHKAIPQPMLLKNEGCHWVVGDPRPYIIEVPE